MTRAVQDTLPPSPSNDRALETLGQASGLAACKPRAALSNPIVAKLFAHYIDVLAPWYDLNESLLPFGATVPAHALECPILFKALIAFSATHKYKTLRQFAELATAFHAACVRELLDSIEHEKPESQGDYLAATCLLRSYEILNADSRKEQRHLLGAYSFVASGSINLVGRGLLQAGAWNYLREEITVALECCRSVRISRDFEYQAYENMPDDMQANHVSYLLARIINLSFGDQVKRIPLENRMVEWHSLDAALNVWKDRLPATFEPYSTAQIAGNVFPSLWMLRPWHVAALQYLSVAEILLAMFRHPSLERNSDVQAFIADHELAQQHALRVCGLAYTNDNAAARVNAFGPLAFCGRYLNSPEHRNGLESMLFDFGRKIGWPVESIIEDLKGWWASTDSL